MTNDPASQQMHNDASYLQHDRWSRAAIEDYQARALQACRQYAYTHSPFYRSFHQGLTERPLQELPVLTKALMMEHFDEIVTDPDIRLQAVRQFLAGMDVPAPYLGRYRAMTTSGSSGEPGVFLFSREEGEAVAATFSRFLSWAGVSPTSKMAVVASTVPRHMSSNLSFTLNGQPLPKIQLSAGEPVENIVQRLNEWQPDGLAGYPSIERILAEEQRQGRLRITPRFIFCASESMTEETRWRISEVWQVQPFNIYAATECGALAAECSSHQGLHLFEDLVILEVVDQNNQPVPPGTYGAKALLTALFRRTQPLIRYELSDSVCLSTRSCACGRSFALVQGIQGRTTDLLSFSTVSGDRVLVHPQTFYEVMDTFPIKEWQIVQQPDGLRILLGGEPEELQDEAVIQALQRTLVIQGVDVPSIRIERVAAIPRNESGKATLIIPAK